MVRISNKLMVAFGLRAERSFKEEMVEHLFGFAPDHAKSLGRESLERIVELGIQRARHYGFTERDSVRFYIELMFHFGSDFDTDPQYPWAVRILKRPWIAEETQVRRAAELFYFCNRCLDDIAGPGHQDALAAMRKALSLGLVFVDLGGDTGGQIHRHLRGLAPVKCEVVGYEGLDLLIQHALSQANAQGGRTAADCALIAVLMFGLGHGCLTDPQFPWVRLTFESSASRLNGDAFQSLRRRSLIYLQHSLDNMVRRHVN